MPKTIWVAHESNPERKVDVNVYGEVVEEFEPKDVWWEEIEVSEEAEVDEEVEDGQPNWAKAAAVARKARGEPPLSETLPLNENGDFAL